ncbi:hypothetical protein PR003_g31984 [Phytophthora rubi]|uniref:Uncharacterized protein n=1 Tax=Phytophthora rubi TaxID=129364 RepID=A0A6A3GPJ8_9STRA|nr:hypothetical protein PR002_g30454 [Phytophthora rubi]KAE9266822.1 hypothetical protein PR003_g31984 [Phytophthora rubi]
MGEDKPAPLLAVKLLFRCKGRFVDLPHVLEAVSLFRGGAASARGLQARLLAAARPPLGQQRSVREEYHRKRRRM